MSSSQILHLRLILIYPFLGERERERRRDGSVSCSSGSVKSDDVCGRSQDGDQKGSRCSAINRIEATHATVCRRHLP
ncbi:inter alpha-trypsin inhibitor, heavy chain 4-like [Iris pallida]|uniref:Inter alpha-trypsin inhibitor, heavy chain 4-like n=1 Tax=Iris pallida TaxID=29817 RepID=A0AAX6DJT9_IRIPA|nr:inter alpha-trypsin inhibitor, heavy chain 4-like [Iris pallida]KAJ6799733.1 inter alpha-trypsin inhibitor, heavy chain 4-like [Iris pallida]